MFNKTKPNDTGTGLNIPTPPEPARATEPYRASEPYRAAETPRPTPASTPPAARSTNLSTLSGGVKYEGNISGGGELQVDGTLKGDVRVARVVIGESGSIEGSVAADIVEVRGRVAGTIAGKSVKLFSSARVEGDITQEQLMIEQGAWFQGRCIQAKRDAPAATGADTPVSAPVVAERYQPEKPVAPAMPGKAEPAKSAAA